MDTKEKISKEIISLYDEGAKLAVAFQNNDKELIFQYEYQKWYTRALRVVEILAPDRYNEFKSYYEIDPKRKSFGYGTYVIQDYIKGVAPSRFQYRDFDTRDETLKCFFNQLTIFQSLSERVDSVLSNLDSALFSEIQDAELKTARQLLKASIRAAGSLAGVIIESHLCKVAKNHGIRIQKKNSNISDLNDSLKKEKIFDTPTWRKVSYFADIRNICSHKKDSEPTRGQVTELIDGANWLIKNIF